MTLDYFLTALVVVLLPGTGVLYTLAIGLGRGFRASIAAAFGCTIGIFPSAFASIVGLAALLHTSVIAFQAVKYAGVVYLLYMAWNLLRDGGAMDVRADTELQPAARIIVNGALINTLNPKLALFFLSFLPQFVPASAAHPTAMLVWLAAVFMVMTFVVFVGYGACAAQARNYAISRPNVMKWIRRSFAGTFGVLSLKLALSER